jgi:type IV fimbrial biogenesis protein FimT
MQVQPSRRLGFTIIELLVTIAIAGVVMGLAVPSFSTAIKNNRITSQVNSMVTSLNVARSEAVKRGARVNLCKSNDGANCVTTGDWDQGWIIYVDQNKNNLFDAAEAPPLKIQAEASGDITILGKSAIISNRAGYSSDGSAVIGGTITVCDSRSGEAVGKNVVISAAGRTRIVPAPGEKGIICP